jgi:molecular chaperone GrpE
MTHNPHEKNPSKDKKDEKIVSPLNDLSPEPSSSSSETLSNQAEPEVGGTSEESVTIPLKEYAVQMKEIDDLNNKIKEYSEGWQRERADFNNYRSRTLRDQDIIRQDITARIVKNYLAVNDDIELALKNAPKNEDPADWIKGIQLIAQKLQNILDTEGVQRIPAENEPFNPHLHEAIATEENPQFESGHVIEIIQQGYTIGDRVIRPARVKVAK